MKFFPAALTLFLMAASLLPCRAAWIGRFEGWQNTGRVWETAVKPDLGHYNDGAVIPFRFVTTLKAGSFHVVRLRYDFSTGGVDRFIDYLASPGATEPNVSFLDGVTLPGDQRVPKYWPIPRDLGLTPPNSSFVQPPGQLMTYNAKDVIFGTSYNTIKGVRELLVCYTVEGAVRSGDRTVVIAFGGHLASVEDWGPEGGASQFPGRSRKAYARSDGRSPLAVSVEPSAAGPAANLELTQTGPAFACPGSEVSYQVTLKNLGPNIATEIELTDLLPGQATLLSAQTSAGTLSGTGPVFLKLASLAPGASATVTFLMRIDAAGNGSAVNLASVTSVSPDPVPGNNSASVSTSTLDSEGPVVTVPADYLLDLAEGQCELPVDFAAAPATATDNCTGVIELTYTPPTGTILGPGDHVVSVTAQDQVGNVTTGTFTVRIRDNPNVSWPAARPLALAESSPGLLQATFSQCLNSFDQSRWYRFSVKPGDQVIAVLSGLPQNYDLVLFRDIQQTYDELTAQAQDLPLLNAQFAADAFSPTAFSPDAFSPAAFSPAAFSPAAFSPAAFSPAAFSPAAFSPAAFSPTAFSPDAYSPAAFSPTAFSPTAFSPTAFSPTAFSPAAFSPAAFSPTAFSPAAFSDAQIRSVIAVSAFAGTANEGLIANAWNSTGEFYVRVRGRNGVFESGAPFELSVYVLTGACEGVELTAPSGTGSGPVAAAGNFHTLILTDSERIVDDGSKLALTSKLAELAARSEVRGRIIDLSAYPQVKWFQAQADLNYECPFAKNLVAASIREVIRQWRALNPIDNLVLVGNDGVIPFFRYPDQAMLGPEKNYVPPVMDLTASQASLRLNYVLGQDAYGASCELSLKVANLPLPEVPVGRLVETPAEIIGMVQAYLETASGVLPSPASALVTGYDFLTDAAIGVEAELAAGMGSSVETLISPANVAPANGWTADQLRQALFGQRHDLVYLAGHFSAFSALAADYETFILASELEAATTDFKNTILFSAGCHSGYNAVDGEGIPFVTPQPDWPQAAARRQATLIAGTGYQYGDTDFIEYSERLYLRFARELRMGSGPVSVGQALLRAKRHYLATTPVMRGIHEKSFLEASLFGLPMLSVNMPVGRLPAELDPSVVGALTAASFDPGQYLGLATAELTVVPSLTEHTVTLQNIEGGNSVQAKYLEGSNGVLVNPAEPILPLEARSVGVANTTLRGVGFRGGTYADEAGVIPLTGAATTEIRGVHASFLTDVLYPVRFWSVNYFDILCGGAGDSTRFFVWPAQFLSDNGVDPVGTLRRHTQLNFRLFYSNNSQAYNLDDGSGTITPALSAPPAINGVFSETVGNKIRFRVFVTGNPAAGIQEVWVTYTAVQGSPYGQWKSFDLTQDSTDSTLWQGELDWVALGAASADVRFLVQAVNGVGLTTLNTRLGALHVPDQNDGWETAGAVPTSVQLLNPPDEADFGDKLTLTASWAGPAGETVANRSLVFNLGNQQVVARTDAAGVATAKFNVLTVPGTYELKVTFQGGFGLAPSLDAASFLIKPAPTQLELTVHGASLSTGGTQTVSARLSDNNGPLIERSVLFIVTGDSTVVRAAITDLTGRARLGALPTGTYSVTATFGERVTLPDGVTVIDLRDVRYLGSQASTRLVVDAEPPAGTITVNKPVFRTANNLMVPVTVRPAFTDASGAPVSVILRVTSNESENSIGGSDPGPDIQITGPLTVDLRAQRAPTGSGRIYTILVETTDPLGNKRQDQVTVTVPR